MYFEVHLTTFPFQSTRKENFQKLCTQLNTKFTMIELAQGQTYMQPMATFISFDRYPRVLEKIIELNFIFYSKGFPISRSKIEYPFQYQQLATQENLNFIYYQTHLKIKYHPDELANLRNLGKKFNAHLSRNSLSNKSDQRFLTYRQYEYDGNKFEQQISDLERELISNKFQIKKIIKQVAVYDSNVNVDRGWLV